SAGALSVSAPSAVFGSQGAACSGLLSGCFSVSAAGFSAGAAAVLAVCSASGPAGAACFSGSAAGTSACGSGVFFSSSSFLYILSILLLSAAARQAAQAGLPAAADRNKRQPRKQRDAERAPGEPAVLDRVGA